MSLPTRPCMLCRCEHLKGFFRHRTDPICIEGMQRIRDQRYFLQQKYKQQYRAEQAAKRHARQADAQ